MAIGGQRTEPPLSSTEVLKFLAAADALQSVNSGMRDTRMRALRLIHASGRRGTSQAAIAGELALSHACVSRLCDELETEGLIVRESHQFDRRMKTLHLSDKGMQQVDHCDRATQAKAAAVIPDMASMEMDSMAGILQQMVAQLQTHPCTLLCQQCIFGGC